MGPGRAHTVEVLVLTAADGEPEALRAVDDGAEGPWIKRHLQDPSWTYDVRSYRRKDGRSFEVALVHARRMGETIAAAVATRFVAELKPSVLAMCLRRLREMTRGCSRKMTRWGDAISWWDKSAVDAESLRSVWASRLPSLRSARHDLAALGASRP